MKKNTLLFIAIIFSFMSIQAQQVAGEETIKPSFDRNNISVFLSDVVLKRLSFEYEHIFGDNGNMSINIPLSVSIGDFRDIYSEQQNWWGGIGMKLYPTGQGRIRYFLGPEVRVISAHNERTIYHQAYYEEVDEQYIHTAFLLNNGMIYEPSEHFIFVINLGVGFISRDQKTNEGIYPMATPSVRIGLRF